MASGAVRGALAVRKICVCDDAIRRSSSERGGGRSGTDLGGNGLLAAGSSGGGELEVSTRSAGARHSQPCYRCVSLPACGLSRAVRACASVRPATLRVPSQLDLAGSTDRRHLAATLSPLAAAGAGHPDPSAPSLALCGLVLGLLGRGRGGRVRRCAPVGGLLQSLDTAPRRRRLGARRLDRQAGPSQEHGCKGVLYGQTDHDGRADDGEKRDQQRARQPTPAPAPARPSAHPRSPGQGESAPLLAALTCSRLAQRMFRYLLSICIYTLSARSRRNRIVEFGLLTLRSHLQLLFACPYEASWPC